MICLSAILILLISLNSFGAEDVERKKRANAARYAEKIEAQEAFELGLVNKVLPLNELLPYAREQALKLITPKAPGLSIRLMRKAVHDMFKDQIYKILDVENEGYTTLLKSENVGIAMSARIKKIEPVFKEK